MLWDKLSALPPNPPAIPGSAAGSGRVDDADSAMLMGNIGKNCRDLLEDTEVQNAIALSNIGLVDVPIVSQKKQQACAENSALGTEGAAPLSQLVDDIPS